MSEKKQKLVLAIIDFLNQSVDDGTVKADDKESLEVASELDSPEISSFSTNGLIFHAVQCIGEAFGVHPSDQQQVQRLSVKPATLQTIFDVFIRTREKVDSSSSASTSSAAASKPETWTPSAEDKAKAEKLKQSGNAQMSSKQYDAAIESYTQAIAFDSTNPIYYSNRAAAHSSKGDHLSAVGDAEQAIAVDPKFVKAYHRLG